MFTIDCPVKKEAERTIELSENYLRSLRRLRRSLRKCRNCPGRQGCQLLEGWNRQIEQAITEVHEEWGLLYGS